MPSLTVIVPALARLLEPFEAISMWHGPSSRDVEDAVAVTKPAVDTVSSMPFAGSSASSTIPSCTVSTGASTLASATTSASTALE